MVYVEIISDCKHSECIYWEYGLLALQSYFRQKYVGDLAIILVDHI